MKNTKVISAFPGTGKTYCYNKLKEIGISVLDSDSSEFSWIKDENGNNTTERNPDFPDNYIKHIKENIGKVSIIFVSSHDIVREAMSKESIDFILVYPTIHSKWIYERRYRERGSSESFIDMMDKNFDKFIEGMSKDKKHQRIELYGNQTISDIFKYGYCNAISKEECPSFVAHNGCDVIGCNIDCAWCNHILQLLID